MKIIMTIINTNTHDHYANRILLLSLALHTVRAGIYATQKNAHSEKKLFIVGMKSNLFI